MDDDDWDEEIRDSSIKYVNSNNNQSNYDNNNNTGKSITPSPRIGIGRGRLLNRNSNDLNSQNNKTSGFGRRTPSPPPRSDIKNNYSSNNRNNYDSNSYASITDYIDIDVKSVSTLIGKQGSTISNIRDKCNVKIFVPNRDEMSRDQTRVEVKIIGSSKTNIEKAKDMINDVVSSNSRYGSKRNNPFDDNYDSAQGQRSKSPFRRDDYDNRSSGSNGFGFRDSKRTQYDDNRSPDRSMSYDEDVKKPVVIDWDAVRRAPTQNLEKFKDHPQLIKDFYVEDPEITAMTKEDVIQFRKENFDITVDLFKKANLSYTKKENENEDTRTSEEKQAYLFENVPKPVKNFEQAFRRYPDIIEECKRQNFVKPSPIQAQMWPILLKGLDCIGIAQTGTGKTLAFLLPALIHIDNQPTPREKRLGPNVLVLSPTRELALQIEKEVKKINYKGIKSVCVYGGGDKKEQSNLCTQGVQIVIATPGRLYDLIKSGVINVTSVTYLVLDEADRMLDLGFEPQIMKILLDIRPDRQTVMTSATWPESVRRLATKYLSEPIQLYVGTLDLRAAKTVTQELRLVQSEDEKKELLFDYILNKMTEEDKLIVFVGRKIMADSLSCDLILKDIKCQSIHGDREQCDREEALEDFKDGTVRILIATDVASRGIDVKDITCVFNYDFPRNIEEYVHRVGRTGRAGRTGRSITIMAREDWKHAKELIEILKEGEQEVPQGLVDMAERYEAMLKRRAEEGGGGRGGRGGRDGGRSGGFNRRDDGGFGSRSNSSDNRSSSVSRSDSNRPFIPRGRRGGGTGGFHF